MIIYRIVHTKYQDDLSGEGARIYGGRWNPKGQAALYCSEHISLCMLENMVNMGDDLVRRQFTLLHLFIPEQKMRTIDSEALKKNWIQDFDYTQWLGNQFLEQDGFILKIPSAIVTEEYNYMLNPLHPDFRKVRVVKATPFYFDERLF